MSKVTNKLLAIVLSFAMVLTGFTFLGGAVAVNAEDGDKPELILFAGSDQPATEGSFIWSYWGSDDSVDLSGLSSTDFGVEVKIGDKDWQASDVSLKLGADDTFTYDGIVTAAVPDNEEAVEKQWRLTYSGSIADMDGNPAKCPAIKQAAAEEAPVATKPSTVYMSRIGEEFQAASGGKFEWSAQNADFNMLYGGEEPCAPMIELVDANDFQLQKQLVTESEWTNVDGDLTLSKYINDGEEDPDMITIEAAIPDNTSDDDISWRVIYKHCEVSLQGESCNGKFHITQIKPEAQPEKPANVYISYDEESYPGVDNPQNQPASGGKYCWAAMDGETWGSLCGKVTADDFELQTKAVTENEWTKSENGSIKLEDVDDYYVRITATIPDNTDDFDKMWRVVYKYSDPSLQSDDPNYFTQLKPEEPPVVLPAIKNIAIDTGADSSADQPAKGGVYAWFFAGDQDADFEEVPADAFSMEVKVGDGEWAASDVEAKFEPGDNYDEGFVTADIPDNTESVAKQWRFKYAGESVECPVITQAAKAEWNQACFTCSEDKATITGLTDEGKAMVEEDPNMVIPASCGDVAVTAIGDNAFAGVKITGVQFPDTLKSIGATAFNGCTELNSITLPASLETLGAQAFNNTSKLDSITFEDGIKITEIPQAAFAKVAFGVQIKEIKVPETVTKIMANAFGGSQVETLVLPAGLTEIGDRAFMNSKLSSVTVPDKVEKIGKQAFSQAQAKVRGTLTSLDFGNNTVISSIGAQAFEYAKLKSVDMPESVKALDKDTFKNNSGGESADKKVILNLTSHDQFTASGDYEAFVADGSGHRSMFNGVMNCQIKFDTAGRSNKNDAYTKDGKLSETDLAAARSAQPYDVFDGWFTEAEGGEAVNADKVYEADTTLYAHWSENTALKEAEPAVADAVEAAETAQEAADKAAETGAAEDAKAAADALDAAQKAISVANEKLAAAQDFANSHAVSGTGGTRTKTAEKNLAKANAGVTKLDADAAKKAAEEAATAAAAAKPGTKDAADKAAAAKKAADEALAKAEAAKEAAEKAYGEDSDEAKAAAQAVEAAKAAVDKAADTQAKTVTTVTVNVKTVNAAAIDKAVKAAGGSEKYVTRIVLGSKVKTIKSSSFKKYTKVTVLEVKTKKLTKKSVKKSLKGSKVKTVKVTISKKAKVNKKYVKKYKKFFTKANAGKKAKVKR